MRLAKAEFSHNVMGKYPYRLLCLKAFRDPLNGSLGYLILIGQLLMAKLSLLSLTTAANFISFVSLHTRSNQYLMSIYLLIWSAAT